MDVKRHGNVNLSRLLCDDVWGIDMNYYCVCYAILPIICSKKSVHAIVYGSYCAANVQYIYYSELWTLELTTQWQGAHYLFFFFLIVG